MNDSRSADRQIELLAEQVAAGMEVTIASPTREAAVELMEKVAKRAREIIQASSEE